MSSTDNPSFYGLASDLAPASSANTNPLIATMKDLGAKSIRIFHSTYFISGTDFGNDFLKAKRFHDAGFQVTVVITPEENTKVNASNQRYDNWAGSGTTRTSALTASNVGTYMSSVFAQSYSGTDNGVTYSNVKLADVVDRYEIGNEPDLVQTQDQTVVSGNIGHYYPIVDADKASGAQHYATNLLTPAWNAIQNNDPTAKVIGGGPTSAALSFSGGPNTPTAGGWLEALLNQTAYLSKCDLANMHPYQSTGNDQVALSTKFVNAVHALAPSKRVTVTEFGLAQNIYRNSGIWASEQNIMQNWAKDNLDSIYYYILEARYTTDYGMGGNDGDTAHDFEWIGALADPNSMQGSTYKHMASTYDMYKNWTAATTSTVTEDLQSGTQSTGTNGKANSVFTASSTGLKFEATSNDLAWTGTNKQLATNTFNETLTINKPNGTFTLQTLKLGIAYATSTVGSGTIVFTGYDAAGNAISGALIDGAAGHSAATSGLTWTQTLPPAFANATKIKIVTTGNFTISLDDLQVA